MAHRVRRTGADRQPRLAREAGSTGPDTQTGTSKPTRWTLNALFLVSLPVLVISGLGLFLARDWIFNTSPEVRNLEASARAGDVTAEKALGNIYWEDFHGVRRDQKKAFSWFLEAANRGDADAAAHVAWAYVNGEGIRHEGYDPEGDRKDELKALEWWVRAAERGSFWGAQEAARIYLQNGDNERALKWYENLAKRGDTGAACPAARIYLQVKQDSITARHYFEQCGDNRGIAYFYLRGTGGVSVDVQKAVTLYQQAAKQDQYGTAPAVVRQLQSAKSTEEIVDLLSKDSRDYVLGR
jgi:TPR repeat protein